MDKSADARDVRTRLRGLGIALPDGEVAQLARTVSRQRSVLADWADQVAPTTEPAHVFRAAPDTD